MKVRSRNYKDFKDLKGADMHGRRFSYGRMAGGEGTVGVSDPDDADLGAENLFHRGFYVRHGKPLAPGTKNPLDLSVVPEDLNPKALRAAVRLQRAWEEKGFDQRHIEVDGTELACDEENLPVISLRAA